MSTRPAASQGALFSSQGPDWAALVDDVQRGQRLAAVAEMEKHGRGDLVLLLDRAAMLVSLHWPQVVVAFEPLGLGLERSHLARLEWEHGAKAPRLAVYLLATGERLCRSVPGAFTIIDPADVRDAEAAAQQACAVAASAARKPRQAAKRVKR